MELSAFIGMPCKGRVAYEFRPAKPQRLDLATVARNLRAEGIGVDIETPVVLILNDAGKGITLSRSGKVLVKHTKDPQEARKAAVRVIATL